MKYISLICLIIFCFQQNQMNAQCNNTLVDKAASQSGADAEYLREFKVRFDGPEPEKPVPTAKYPIMLSKNTSYRFNVANAEELEGRVILQLFLKDKLMGSTFDTQTSIDLQRFDFRCNKTATYEIVMSFDQGKPGCAVGILSLISDKDAKIEDEELDILYAQADNPMFIYDDEDEFAQIEVSIDNGSITKVEGVSYVIHPKEKGLALLTIRVMNRDGSVRELKRKRFAVLTLDKPYAAIKGINGNILRKEDLMRSDKLELWFSTDMKCNYKIISFTISDRNDLISGISTNSSRLSRSQRDWIRELPSGTKVYIKNIQARTADRVVVDIAPLEFEVE